MTKEDISGEEPGRFSVPKRRDLFSEYLASTNEDRQDVIFRRVRGILNKITPETFDKLSKDLVNVGLDSPRTLRGVIYLLFDKALKDLKYSSLYAKLCQKLSEKSPNFEKEPGPNTFCKFLISKCEDEFERRRKATEDYERKKELTDEEFELKVIAKQKMLGNIKFICELGKKRLLQEEILHECIRGLLSRKKERPLQDQAQDLECLCQIMRTIGSLLDIETSKNLMNQYFERIDMYSRKQELPSRIRFMLKDVIDLRNNNWRPRPFQREDNVPQPLSKLREEAGFSNAASNAPNDKLGNTKNLMNINNLSRMNASKLSSLLIDDDEPGFTTTTDFHWGSTAFLPHENEFDIFSSNTYNHKEMSNTTPAANPNRTQGATTAQNSLFDLSTVSFNSSSNFQGSTGPIAPRFLQASRYESFVGGGQNHFDTFVHSTQVKDGKVCHDKDAASNMNDGMSGKRNDPLSERYMATARGYDRRFFKAPQSQTPFANSSQMTTMNVKPFEFDAITQQQSVRDEHLRCNNLVRNTAPQNQNPHNPQRHHSRSSKPNDDLPLSQPYIDSPRPLPHSRTDDNPLSSRNTFMPRNQHSYDAAQPPAPTPAHLMTSLPVTENHSRNMQSEHFMDGDDPNQPNHRQNQGPPSNGHARSRRFERGGRDRHEHEPRQPKFSGANYRLPGRDRPPPQNVGRNANQQPESDLNLNWRATDSTRPKQSPAKDTVDQQQATQVPAQRQKSINENRNIVEDKQHLSPGDGEGNNKFDFCSTRNPSNQGFTESDTKRAAVQPQQQITSGNDKSKVSNQSDYFTPNLDSRRTPSPLQTKKAAPSEPRTNLNKDHSAPRLNNVNHNTNANDTNLLQSSKQRQVTHDGQDHKSIQQDLNASTQNNRNISTERRPNDRRDFKNRDEAYQNFRVPPPSQHLGNARHDNGHKQSSQRNSDANHDRKTGRPQPLGRNASFEGHNDFKRSPNWRNENSGQNNHLPKKDILPAQSAIVSAHHQVLSRPPVRMSETDFSLRPSHNLIGRAVTESNLKTVERNTNVVPDKTGSASQPDIKPASTIPPVDLSARQIFGPKKTPEVSTSEPKVDKVEKHETDIGNGKVLSILKDYISENTNDTSKLNLKLKDLKVPKELHEDCLVSAMKHTIVRSDTDRERASKLFSMLVPNFFETSALLNAFKIIFEQMKALEVETPKVKSLVAGFLSRAVVDGLLTIEEVARILVGGKHHPLFLLFLQKLEKSAGQAWLSDKFVTSKINLMEMLPELDRTKDRLASILKDRCLGFLDPMLTIEPDLWEQMRDKDPSPAAVYRWIKDNVDQTIQNTPMFAQVFISCLLKYIHNVTAERLSNNNNNNSNINNNQQNKDSDSSDSNKSSPTNSSSQGINDHEKELLSKYQQMMHAILRDKQMQLATLYALQSFYHGLNFPKGALLRWFHMLYDLSIVDDDVYFIWKEEINDKVPGKGQALFQVNTWLNWLAEPDSEEEEE